MRVTLLFLWLATVFLVPMLGADTEKPPENILKHFEWCGAPKDASVRTARYEGFWTRYHPTQGDYEDAIQATSIRQTAYRLAALYAHAKNSKKCREMLEWLEAHDQAIPK
jgi:hypothetical protein